MARAPIVVLLLGSLLGSIAACAPPAKTPSSIVAVPLEKGARGKATAEPRATFVAIEVETKTIAKDRLDISYPIIRHPNPAAAAALAKIIQGYASPYDGGCGTVQTSVVSANSGLVSIHDSRMLDACVDPERDALAEQGMGGAPAGPRVRASLYRIDGGRVTEVSLDEVVAPHDKARAAIRRYCEKELASPDPDNTRHEGLCYSCDGIDRIDSDRSEWSFGVTEDAIHFYLSGAGCDLVMPYEDVAPWLAPDSPALRTLHGPEGEGD